MLEIQELSNKQIDEVLKRLDYGHLACSKNDVPYVVPIHFVYHTGEIFIYTTEGKKSDIIDKNPRVCIQTEEVTDNQNWISVIVEGIAERVSDPVKRERVIKRVLVHNPTLTPALSIHWMDNWVRENIEVVYRITPTVTSGRQTLHR